MAFAITFPDQYLALDGVPLSTTAWELLNLEVVLSGPAVRGSNIVIPGASGVRARRHRQTEKTVTLEMAIFGDTDPEGVPHADPRLGLLENMEALRALTDPRSANHSIIAATLYWRGSIRSAGVQVAGFEVGAGMGPVAVAAAIDIVLVQGAFA